ncbi:DUF4062 domain-containing protein [Iocasia frigidifontis]|uniref:DUF4062 domain-containing protein n=1 Tax=Iocasia fonsfrigidae TaxID=2682810 RepID=A0A8A7KIZ4_9FIRM|nr:DUF4062 domain-containing protein [Iocasia fonsfrigidae]
MLKDFLTLRKFIRELGYEAVKNEGGDIPYGKKKTLEDYCYREINNVDILINIIGGRYGSASKEEPYSISQKELKVAHELNKQIYIFVQQSVLVEYKTYLKNEANENFMPEYVDNIQIYKFLKEVYNYPTYNTVVGFSKVSDITNYLRSQWAGLFQRFLEDESRRVNYMLSKNLKSTAETLSQLIEYTTRERDETIKNIMVQSHPVFTQISQKTNIPIRIFFTNRKELDTLLKSFGYEEVEILEGDVFEIMYKKQSSGEKRILKINPSIFDNDGELKPVKQGEWNKTYVEINVEEIENVDEYFDVPF